MTNHPAQTLQRNNDLVPLIQESLEHHKLGDLQSRDALFNNVNSKLTERGDSPDEFWGYFVEFCKWHNKDLTNTLR